MVAPIERPHARPSPKEARRSISAPIDIVCPHAVLDGVRSAVAFAAFCLRAATISGRNLLSNAWAFSLNSGSSLPATLRLLQAAHVRLEKCAWSMIDWYPHPAPIGPFLLRLTTFCGVLTSATKPLRMSLDHWAQCARARIDIPHAARRR